MLVMADMQRRLIAANRPEGEILMDDDLADMEAAAAVFARLAAHKLQKTTHDPVKRFCELFGLVLTEDIDRMMADAGAMDPASKKKTQKMLQEAFKLKKTLSSATTEQQRLQENPPPSEGSGAGDEREKPTEGYWCPRYGEGCTQLKRGQRCTHTAGEEGGGSKYPKGGGKGGGKGKGRRW